MNRRELLTGAVLSTAGAGAALGAAADGSPAVQSSRLSGDETAAKLLIEIRDELRAQRSAPCNAVDCSEISTIRNLQRTFLRSRGKFPDFIDVGIEVWERLTDWHIKHLLPVQAARMADGRYAMSFGLTTLVLRHDMTLNYVGEGYDK